MSIFVYNFNDKRVYVRNDLENGDILIDEFNYLEINDILMMNGDFTGLIFNINGRILISCYSVIRTSDSKSLRAFDYIIKNRFTFDKCVIKSGFDEHYIIECFYMCGIHIIRTSIEFY